MTQDLKYLHSMGTAKNNPLELKKQEASESVSRENDLVKEQLKAAQDSIQFLQSEHSRMLKGLHEEMERLYELCRDLQFRCEVGGYIISDNDFFRCSPECLEQKVNALLQENTDLKRKLNESHQAIDILDQKEKLALWQHHQEMEQRDTTILHLERELEAKCTILAQLSQTQGARRKKGNFWRRFSFVSSANNPSTSSSVLRVQPPRVEHLSREDLPSEMQQSFESQYQSYSSYSSLSDKSISDDEGFAQDRQTSLKLPPIPHLPLVATKLKMGARKMAPDSLLAMEPPPDMSLKRLNKT